MTDFYPINAEIIKYADLCAYTHNISSLYQDFSSYLSYSSSESGFDGFALKNDETKEIIIVFKGSSDNEEDLNSVSEILSGHIPTVQLNDADTFYQNVLNSISTGYSLSITGFSLGGALAQIIGTKYGTETYTFNALGINSETILNEVNITSDQVNFATTNNLITNFAVMNDPIGNIFDHIGTTYYLPPIFPVDDPIESHQNILKTDVLNNLKNYFSLTDWSFKESLALWQYDKINNGEIPNNTNLLHTFNSVFTQFSDQEITSAFHKAIEILKSNISHDDTYTFTLPSDIDSLISLGGSNDDTISTFNDNDIIYGGDGSDVLTANTGNDFLAGESGDDSYLINKGDGVDFIQDSSGINDTIKFGAGITYDNLIFSKDGNNLIINFNASSSDQIIVYNHFSSGQIEYYMFDDGSIVDYYNIDDSLQSQTHILNLADSGLDTDFINSLSSLS